MSNAVPRTKKPSGLASNDCKYGVYIVEKIGGERLIYENGL
jgi:hypothetical protein